LGVGRKVLNKRGETEKEFEGGKWNGQDMRSGGGGERNWT